jgi:hypothetical protein
MWFWEGVLQLIEGHENPGFMRPENVGRFLKTVMNAEQRLPNGTADHLRVRRGELMRFLNRAIALKEPIWCDL